MQCQRKTALRLAATLIITLLFALPSPSGAQSGSPQKWALLIGIDRYKNSDRITDLSSAARDARGLKAALRESAGVPEDHIRLLVSDAAPGKEGEALPDRAAILRELAMLSRRTKPGDVVFVCYSGHGVELPGQGACLLPWDADPYDEGTLADTAIAETKLVERLKAMPAGLLLIALDMCRTQPIKTGKDGISAPNPLTAGLMRGMDFVLPDKTPPGEANSPRAVVRLWSCAEGQRSWEWTGRQRSYFSYFLEKGLRGEAADKDGSVRANGLSAYLRENVTAKVREGEKQEQTPLYKVEGAISASRLALSVPGAVTPDKLAPAPGGATDTRAPLALTLEPKDATVTVDGAARNGNPVVINLGDEKEKVVEVAVSAAGYKTNIQNVTLIRGVIAPLSVTLEKSSPVPVKPVVGGAAARIWRDLFDGKTLTGWERTVMSDSNGGTGGHWEAGEGGVVAWQDENHAGGLLRTADRYGDFELEMDFLLDVPADSGIFLRTNSNGDGYQITLDEVAGGTVGCLFSTNGGFLSKDYDFKSKYRLGEWNHLRARIEGQPAHIQIWLNDQQTVEFTDSIPRGTASGYIGLQVRGGAQYWGDRSRVHFRNVRLRPLGKDSLAAAKTSPSSASDTDLEAALAEARRLRDEKRFGEARAAFERATTLKPQDVGAWVDRGWNAVSAGNKPEYLIPGPNAPGNTEAEQCFRQAVAVAPNDVRGVRALVSLLFYRQDKNTDEIEALFRRSIALEEATADYNGIAEFLHRKRQRYAEADGYYRKALERHKIVMGGGNGWLPCNYGDLMVEWKKDWREAERLYRLALIERPNYSWFHADLAGALLRQGRKDEALAEARKALDLSKTEKENDGLNIQDNPWIKELATELSV